ncbi:hypothetical protein I5P78_22635 [Serratia marcescens]|nr:hypothetical protein [Serratia marcescens]
MDEAHHKILSINNFYYCLTIALKLHRLNCDKSNRLALNRFLIKWVKNARDRKIFPINVNSEIDWVLRVMFKQGIVIDAESFFENIYLKTKSLLDGFEQSG